MVHRIVKALQSKLTNVQLVWRHFAGCISFTSKFVVVCVVEVCDGGEFFLPTAIVSFYVRVFVDHHVIRPPPPPRPGGAPPPPPTLTCCLKSVHVCDLSTPEILMTSMGDVKLDSPCVIVVFGYLLLLSLILCACV